MQDSWNQEERTWPYILVGVYSTNFDKGKMFPELLLLFLT